jgi:Transglycosylase-like domain
MRTRIALAAAMTATSTSIIFNTVIIANGAAAAGTKPRSATSHQAFAVKLQPARSGDGSAGRIALTDIMRTAGTGAVGAVNVRSLAAQLSMWNAVRRVASTAQAPTARTPDPGPDTAGTPGAAAPSPPSTAAPPPTDATSTATANWDCIRVHESGNRYNSPAAPSGAYGILLSTWSSFGLSGWPYEAPAAQQDALALQLYQQYGWTPWSTRYACGLG